MPSAITSQTPPSALNLLKTVRDTCQAAIDAGLAEKRRVYEPGATECLKLYLGDYRHLFNPSNTQEQFAIFTKIENAANARRPRIPMFKIFDNVAARMVITYLPFLMGDEMVRTVVAKKPYIPPPEMFGIVPQNVTMQAFQAGNIQFVQDQQMRVQQYQQALMQMDTDYKLRVFRAQLQEALLNYNVDELDLSQEVELALIESLVLGGGAMMTGIVDMPANMGSLVGSQWIPMDDIVYDPDVKRAKDAKWLAVRFRYPKWLVSSMTGIPEVELKGSSSSSIAYQQYRSLLITAGHDGSGQATKPVPKDEVVVWKFYSRMGIGARMQSYEQRDQMYATLDNQLGDFTYLMISDCVDYPLNLPPMLMDTALQMSRQMKQNPMVQSQYDPVDVIRAATKWPVSYFLDQHDPWPIAVISYYHRTGSPYPVPPLEFAISYIKFMIWILSFIADKTYRSNRDIIVCDEKLSEQLIDTMENCEDEPIVKIKQLDEKGVQQFVQFLQMPPLHKDIIDVYMFFQEKFEEITGLTQLKQGKTQRQMRSATEAEVISQGDRIQPAKMGDDVDAFHVLLARKESLAAQEVLKGKDLQFLFGQWGAMAWDQAVQSTNVMQISREADYDVETGRGKRLDIQTRRQNIDQVMTTVMPLLVSFAQETGFTDGVNGVLREYAEAHQIDPQLIQLPSTEQLQGMMQQRQAQEQQAEQQNQAQGEAAAAHGQMAVQQHAASLPEKKSAA